MTFKTALRRTNLLVSTLKYETQQSQLKLSSDQLKRYLNVIHGQSAAPKNVKDVIKHLQEEIQVGNNLTFKASFTMSFEAQFHKVLSFQLNSYLVKEKLPLESSHLQKELNIMQMIATEQHPTRSDLLTVQDKVRRYSSYYYTPFYRRESPVSQTNLFSEKIAGGYDI